MTGQETERPNELIEHVPVTLRRFRADDLDALFQAVSQSLGHLRPWMPWAAGSRASSASPRWAAARWTCPARGHGHRRGLAPNQTSTDQVT